MSSQKSELTHFVGPHICSKFGSDHRNEPSLVGQKSYLQQVLMARHTWGTICGHEELSWVKCYTLLFTVMSCVIC